MSVQPVPATWRSSCCRPWWILRELMHSVGRAMRRSEASVLVFSTVRPWVRVRWRERWMVAVPLSRSRSSQWRPRSSPLRSPVRRASSCSACSRSPLAAWRSCRASATVCGWKRLGRGAAVLNVPGYVARQLILADGLLRGGLEDRVDVRHGQRRQHFAAALADGAAGTPGRVSFLGAALVAGAEPIEEGAYVACGEPRELLLAEPGDEVEADAGGVAGVDRW
ncbi:hypothetical protein GGE06_006060 [Streptomyces sp. SFB5A]|uniref:Uncharacterized protein n=1 Tax=Streptomyces nymphaeiformis TaxID=2663842 RepID=A0A7W7U7K7_9ACTN|nr:hypothetical protein [Streptomyces nymphaeiformis]